jgi:thymidylate synthase (FAD)
MEEKQDLQEDMQEGIQDMKEYIKLLWVTNDAEKQIMRMARVSSDNRDSDDTRLLSYLIRNKHFSPFEMANLAIEIKTSRAIIRQILRHRSFSFQEFSQRYASPNEDCLVTNDARRSDLKNRQNSIDDLPEQTRKIWQDKQKALNKKIYETYQWGIDNGIAKECVRAILPEGNTLSIICINGTIRSWIHYLQLRTGNGTQLEHKRIADGILEIFKEQFPIIYKAAFI